MYMLRARGDSMIEAGIDDGDIVLIKRQDTAQPGQIVVALTGGEATLKRYFPEPEKRRVRLQPENSSMEPIYATGVAVIVEATTDNRNRTAGNVRACFSKYHGNLGQTGCVSFMFDEKG